MGAHKFLCAETNAHIGANKNPSLHSKPLSLISFEIVERKEHTNPAREAVLPHANGVPAGSPPLTQRQPAGLGKSLNTIGFAALTASVACGTQATHSLLAGWMRGFFFAER